MSEVFFEFILFDWLDFRQVNLVGLFNTEISSFFFLQEITPFQQDGKRISNIKQLSWNIKSWKLQRIRKQQKIYHKRKEVHSAGAVKYTDCNSVKG